MLIKLPAAQQLALLRARHGLTRRQNGWSTDHPAIDPRDLLNFRTVQALVEHGLLSLSPCGRRASLTDKCRALNVLPAHLQERTLATA